MQANKHRFLSFYENKRELFIKNAEIFLHHFLCLFLPSRRATVSLATISTPLISRKWRKIYIKSFFHPRIGIWCVVVAGFYPKNPWIAFLVCTVYCVRALQMSVVYLAISMWMNLKAIVNSSASNYICHFLHGRAWFMDVLLVFFLVVLYVFMFISLVSRQSDLRMMVIQKSWWNF